MRVHMFVDAENVNPKLFEKSYVQLKKQYDIAKVSIFSKEETLPRKYDKWQGEKFEYIRCFYGKNSADTFMTASIVKAVYEEILTDYFAIITQDRDFIPAIKVVTENHKTVILITELDRGIDNLDEAEVNLQFVKNLNFNLAKPMYRHKIPDAQWKHLVGYDMSQTIFLKNGRGELIETPFCNGMWFDTFTNILPIQRLKRGYSKNTTLTKILEHNYLRRCGGNVYVDVEHILQDVK